MLCAIAVFTWGVSFSLLSKKYIIIGSSDLRALWQQNKIKTKIIAVKLHVHIEFSNFLVSMQLAVRDYTKPVNFMIHTPIFMDLQLVFPL